MKDKQALMRIQTNQQLSDIKNVPKRNKTTKKNVNEAISAYTPNRPKLQLQTNQLFK